MKKGIVKWFNVKKGYGFITVYNVLKGDYIDILVHYSTIYAKGFKNLKKGQKVYFETATDETGRLYTTKVVAKKCVTN